MPIEDVAYLKAHSTKQNYVFLVDSKDRERATYPTPSDYVVRFSTPFANIVGLEVLEATIPRTMYNVDVANNRIRFCIYVTGYALEKTYTTAEVPIGDYSITTLIPAINAVLISALLGEASTVAQITAASLSNPPDVRNTLVFTCPYPFELDMAGSSIAEALGFDLHVAERDNGSKYTVDDDHKTKPRLYKSVDKPWPAVGPDALVFEGPRGVLRNAGLTQTSWLAQRWTAPYAGFFVGLDVALTTSADDSVVWELRTDAAGAPGQLVQGATGVLAISQTDGGFSDATIPTNAPIQVMGAANYWVVLRNNDARSSRVYYNDVIATETTFLRSTAGAGGPWTPEADANGVFYHMSARVRIAEAYHRIEAPGLVSLVGERYVTLRCPEIEDNMVRSLTYGRMGLAKLRLGVTGFSENRVDFNKIAVREFHPIGKLSRISLRFERGDGELYDFKGVNHTIVFALHYYEPVQREVFQNSILQPNYKMDFHTYQHTQDAQEEESDDQSVDYNEDGDVFNQWKAVQQRNLPEQRYLQDIETLKRLRVMEMQVSEDDEEEEEEVEEVDENGEKDEDEDDEDATD